MYSKLLKTLPGHSHQVFIYLATHHELTKRSESNCLARTLLNPAVDYLNQYLIDKARSNDQKNAFIDTNSPHLLALVDIAPEQLLTLLKTIIDNPFFKTKLIKDIYFRQVFLMASIRAFSLAENLMVSGNLFYYLMKTVSALDNENYFDLHDYLENFFVSAFVGDQTNGFMSAQAKLAFLSHHISLAQDVNRPRDSNYSNYILQGLLKAADPDSDCNIIFYKHRCYFNHPEGYIDYTGKLHAFCYRSPAELCDYHTGAIEQLIIYYHQQKDSKAELILKQIMEIFKRNSLSPRYSLMTEQHFIIDVASVIAAKLRIDKKLYQNLLGILESKKICCVPKSIFDKQICSTLHVFHLNQLKSILDWRKAQDFKEYDLANTNLLLNENEKVIKDTFNTKINPI